MTDDLQNIYNVWSLENVDDVSFSKTTSKLLSPDTSIPCSNPYDGKKGVYTIIYAAFPTTLF